ncbi:hypothetical protein OSH11_13680 [Kaistia dalseonensis]|uniref:AAA+ ATPase domain-containing protein n=1 Tax=Kaistia dalseonensis TaxID=410840 RepID=A0ABU0HA41_9HYPH|nr:hypothetical protein [Kaistia dalseonensis]MCX5495759.1 hypothetical protein [Kaistia dalseonensis]MDQ0438359.1 hypothetical protein [Kaistia dalseonensis]
MTTTEESGLPTALLDTPLAIIGTTGSGKTYVAKGAVELLLELGRRVCIVDPLDVWHGLRTSADGVAPAFPVVIFGGDHADVPINPTMGGQLGSLIARGVAPAAIVVTADMTGGETNRFLTAFFEELFARNREVLHLVLDEADAFAPQNPTPGAERLKGAVDKIARRGRVKGFRLMTITQRPAVLDKSVLSQISTLVSMQLTSPQDRKALEGWIKGNADEGAAKVVQASLPKLARGEGWIWSPAADVLRRVHFPAIRTLDTSRTPEPGERLVEARAAATVDISAIRDALGSAAAPAAPDVAPTSARIAPEVIELEKASIEQRGYERGYAEGARTGVTVGWKAAATSLLRDIAGFRNVPGERDHDLIADLLLATTRLGASEQAASLPVDAAPAIVEPLRPAAAPVRRKAADASSSLSGPQRQLLEALVFWAELGEPMPTRAQIAAVAGWKVTSGHLRNIAGSLRAAGLVDYPAEGRVSMTDAGRSAAPEADSSIGVIERVSAILSGPQRDALGVLLRSDDGCLTRVELARRAGWNASSGHLRNVLGSLRTLDLVTYPGPGEVELTAWVRAARG